VPGDVDAIAIQELALARWEILAFRVAIPKSFG
jgi:hypothetical protein